MTGRLYDRTANKTRSEFSLLFLAEFSLQNWGGVNLDFKNTSHPQTLKNRSSGIFQDI
jgi:hypothetical protein